MLNIYFKSQLLRMLYIHLVKGAT